MENNFDKRALNWDQEKHRIERANTVAKEIINVVNPQNKLTSLEFGCGTGLLGFSMIDHFKNMIFTDPSTEMINQVNNKIRSLNIKNAETLLTKAEDFKPAENVDCIFSLMTLHHIEEHQHVIETMCNYLNKNGYLCIADLDSEDGSFHSNEKVPHNGFSRGEIISLLAANGMETVYSDTVFINKKIVNGFTHDFPMFLIIGKNTR